MNVLSNKRVEALAKEVVEDFAKIVVKESVTTKEAAMVMDYSDRRIRDFVKDGDLPGYRNGRTVRISTLGICLFYYKRMHLSPREIRRECVDRRLRGHNLVR